MEATKEDARFLDKIRPPRLEEAGLEVCALPPDSIMEAFRKAASAVSSVLSSAHGDCTNDPLPGDSPPELLGTGSVAPPSKPCAVEKGGIGDASRGADLVGSGLPEAKEDVIVTPPEENEGGDCVDGLRGLEIGEKDVKYDDEEEAEGPILVEAAGSSFGTHFRVTTYGESHGGGVGCIIDGCPPRLPLSEEDMQIDLDRRRPGQSRITTPRKETDTCTILSGIADGVTTGTPTAVNVPNTDQRGHDYSEMSKAYRPSHADATYDAKYGVRSVQGGGRSSARETIGRVAAGAVAKKILKSYAGTEVLAYVSQAHKVVLPEDLVDYEKLTLEQIESNIARCPDPEYAEKMIAAIDAVRIKGDSVGGVVTCIVRNVPKGLGTPVFDKLEAELAKALMSLPATKGFEIGSGFSGTFMTGSEHNDEFYIDEHGKIRTRTNRSGGIQGGISNGEIIYMRLAFKPTSTISKKQNTVTRDKVETELIARGRHDPCVVPRAVPMVEAMVALVLVDQLMANYSQCQLLPIDSDLQEPITLPKLEPAGVSL